MSNTKISLSLVSKRIQKLEREGLNKIKGGLVCMDPPPIEEFTS